MGKQIALIGCGNIGSRHLQALIQLPTSTVIDIVEPNHQAVKTALKRLEEIKSNKISHKLNWYTNLNDLRGHYALTVIATTSLGRVELIEKLLRLGHSRFLIEKIVCQSIDEYKTLLNNINKFKAKGWVNTNLRYFSSYQKIKNYFKKSKIIHISLTTASHYGLGTNAIHYLDLFSWFTNDYRITLNGNSLFDKLFPNKRSANLVEFAGSITGTISNGSSITLSFIPNANLPLILNIYGDDNKHLIIDETNQKIFNILNKKQSFDYVYEHVSSLTTKIVNDIIKNDDCRLSTLENSYFLHRELFRIFCLHVEKLTHKKSKICPIT